LGTQALAVAEAIRTGQVVIHGHGLDRAHLAAILQAAAVNGADKLAEVS
jgi:hypothetical protein